MSAQPTPVSRRSIEGRFIVIVSVVVLAVTVVSYGVLYSLTIAGRVDGLQQMAQSQARLIESVGKFDAFFQSSATPGAARSATVSQIKESHRQYEGFGETGEIVLAERVGDQVVFLLPTRKRDFQVPDPVPFDADRAGPMILALSGQSGTTTALDHQGVEVLAAYEYLPFMDMGLVAKIDMSEVRAPFIRSGLIALALAGVLVAVAGLLNLRTISPLLSQVYESSRLIRNREREYRTLVANIPGVVYRADLDERRRFRFASDGLEKITGHPAADFLEGGNRTFAEIVHPDDIEIFRRAGGVEALRPGHSYSFEYRIFHADGSERWIHDQGSVIQRDDSEVLLLDGVMVNITDRKAAESMLEELPRKLSRYLSPQVYRSIFEGSQEVKVGSARKKLTVFISDIVGFTATSEQLDPEDLSYVINSYLNRMATIAVEHGGTLDKFIGDGVVIFFGDPESRGIGEDARACVRMALAMRHAVAELNQDIIANGIDAPIRVRVGITTGFCTVGNFGSESRMDYTILGKTVNLASRLESSADVDEVQIAHETYLLVRDDFKCEPKDPIQVKGVDQPVQVYRVAGARG